MIFHENTSSDDLILPPINTAKPDTSQVKAQIQPPNQKQKIESSSNTEQNKPLEILKKPLSNNSHQNHLTMDVNKIENNRYKIDEKEKENIVEENSKIIDKEQEKKTQEKSKTLSTIKTLTNNNNPYIAKVILENIRSLKDCIFLLENYLKSNNIETYYETNTEPDKIIFIFADEKIAFEFTKIIYCEKSKNYLYKNIRVHYNLEPNKTFLKKQRIKNRKKGLNYESIMHLYRGSSYVKKVKEPPKILGNIDLGIKSPFYVVKLNKIKTKHNSKSLRFNGRNITNSIDGYIGYDGNPLKSFEKLKINVLDTHYNPFSNIKYREIDKNKWVCPSNFKCY